MRGETYRRGSDAASPRGVLLVTVEGTTSKGVAGLRTPRRAAAPRALDRARALGGQCDASARHGGCRVTALDPSFWHVERVAPIGLFRELREFVLERSHTRLPKWRFRVADDLVMYVQPKPAERRDRFYAFDCCAFAASDPGTLLNREDCDAGRGLWRLVFGIDPEWRVEPRRLRWPRRDEEGAFAFRARVIGALRSDAFDRLDARRMLSPSCLICGKALTDPISIARWIGPECAGRSGSSQRVWLLAGAA